MPQYYDIAVRALNQVDAGLASSIRSFNNFGNKIEDTLKPIFGKRGGLDAIGDILTGRGAIHGLTQAFDIITRFSQATRQIAEDLNSGKLSMSGLAAEAMRGIPVFGQAMTAGQEGANTLGTWLLRQQKQGGFLGAMASVAEKHSLTGVLVGPGIASAREAEQLRLQERANERQKFYQEKTLAMESQVREQILQAEGKTAAARIEAVKRQGREMAAAAAGMPDEYKNLVHRFASGRTAMVVGDIQADAARKRFDPSNATVPFVPLSGSFMDLAGQARNDRQQQLDAELKSIQKETAATVKAVNRTEDAIRRLEQTIIQLEKGGFTIP